MGKEYIVTIIEGEKLEKQALESIYKHFIQDDKREIVILPFKTHIYKLWKILRDDDFETSIIEILKEIDDQFKIELDKIEKRFISEIFLFFDYDGQVQGVEADFCDEVLEKMINTFDCETNQGKMYISYPMSEALKDVNKIDCCSRRCHVPGKEKFGYKNMIDKMHDYNHIIHYNRSDWGHLIYVNLIRANCLVNNCTEFPTYKKMIHELTQMNVFSNQVNKYCKDEKIAVLSAFPLFICEYLGEPMFSIEAESCCKYEIDSSCLKIKEDII